MPRRIWRYREEEAKVKASTSSRSETALLPLMQMGVYEVKLIRVYLQSVQKFWVELVVA